MTCAVAHAVGGELGGKWFDEKPRTGPLMKSAHRPSTMAVSWGITGTKQERGSLFTASVRVSGQYT